MEKYNGVIVVYKEKGCSSFDVIRRLRKILGVKKMGHTGTLDPDAEGVLPVCIGNATKLCGMLTDSDKTYVADMIFGIETDTLDTSGEILKTGDTSELTEDVISEAILSFVREYDQVPPMYSAIKVDGKKLVDLARKGQSIERKPRKVKIKKIDILSITLPGEPMPDLGYPESAGMVTAKIRVECSKGTYIRSLVSDIGDRLGCGAAMSGLIRTRAGSFSESDSLKIGEIEKLVSDGSISEHIILAESMFQNLPRMFVKPGVDRLLGNGNPLSAACFAGDAPELNLLPRDKSGDKAVLAENTEIRVYFSDGEFAAIYKYNDVLCVYRPVKMFVSAGRVLSTDTRTAGAKKSK